MIKNPRAHRTRGNTAEHKIPHRVAGLTILIPYQSSIKPTTFRAKRRYKSKKARGAMSTCKKSTERNSRPWEKEVEEKTCTAWLRATARPMTSAAMMESQNNHLPKNFNVSIRPSCLVGTISLIIPKHGFSRAVRGDQMRPAIFPRDCDRPCSGNRLSGPCEIQG